MAESRLPLPRYTVTQAINVAIAVGMRALEEVRALAAVKAAPAAVDLADVERMIAEAVARLPPPPRGLEGPPGKFAPPTAWTKGIHYEGALVTHGGSTYCAGFDTADEPPHQDWTLVAARGADAPIGDVCGLYTEGRQYRKFDLVAWSAAEWRAKYDDPGPLPGDGWAISAKAGKSGRPGDPGPKGDPGPQGGPAPVIKEWVRDGYRAIPIMGDGTAGPPLDVREFFELYHSEAH